MNKPTVRSIFPPEIKLNIVTLKEIEPSFFEFLVRIFNDQNVLGESRTVSGEVTLEFQKKWFNRYIQRDERYYISLCSSSGIPFGTRSVNYLDSNEMNIICGRLIIDKKATKNYSYYLMHQSVGFLQFAFEKGINKSYIYVKKNNLPAQKYFHKLGYLKTNEVKYKEYLGEQVKDFEEYVLTKKRFKDVNCSRFERMRL